jgi:hypothetical protein
MVPTRVSRRQAAHVVRHPIVTAGRPVKDTGAITSMDSAPIVWPFSWPVVPMRESRKCLLASASAGAMV